MRLFSSDKRTHDLVVAKLASSGLTPEDGAQLGMRGLLPSETTACHAAFRAVRSLYIPYYGPCGSDESDWPNCPPYYRLRYLEAGEGFAQIAEEKKESRYVQPPSSLPVVYYPKTYDEWPDTCHNPEHALIITEGELKAAKACKEGFPTIGFGGVHAFQSSQHGVEWITSLTYIEWRRRHTYICYDSDLRMNKHVQHAITKLTDALQDRGAYVYLIKLPELGAAKKVGLDDYFVQIGAPAAAAFKKLITLAEPLGATKALFALNKDFVFVENPGVVVRTRTGQKIPVSLFKDTIGAKKRYQSYQLAADGSARCVIIAAGKPWIEWPLRHDVDCMTYAPGNEREYVDARGATMYNTWPGWACEPQKGDVRPFLTLVDHLFTNAEKGAKEWFLMWCAYPIQFPGVKMFSSAVIHGRYQGTGKSLIGHTLKKIYGANFTEISQGDLHANFNEWAENKQFVMGDDVTGSDKRQDNDLLKKMITQSELRVNAKYIPSYVIPDCINYYFTSNHATSFFLEDDDRRFFVHEVTATKLPDVFYKDYGLWMDSHSGPSALFYYFQHLDLSDFDHEAAAFKTAAKNRMIVGGRSDLASWISELIETPDIILRVGETVLACDLWTTKELLHLYDPQEKTRVGRNGLARALTAAGVQQVLYGGQARLSDGSKHRYFAVRNTDKWIRAKEKDVVKHIEESRSLLPQPPKY